MKIRNDFVTNSSSSSYIICFARISDEEKANKIITKHNLDVLNVDDVKHEMRWGYLGADWAGASLWGTDKILEKHPDDKYIIIEECLRAEEYWDDEIGDVVIDYDYNFRSNDAINDITEENGFTDIDCAEGEGRDG